MFVLGRSLPHRESKKITEDQQRVIQGVGFRGCPPYREKNKIKMMTKTMIMIMIMIIIIIMVRFS